ncbi:predicted protein [Lichtheimia corymbifera JMRC:FSU:9682]|uniref:Uncharacterized protein n=1 Tax=Lichtheimia corymbifera JMRC:FSU:9682 TaxID=1263082 RepID=A0A068RWU7_9FUNG|nr:predicted protein [Lichtheimia corymbifera JMRC:FSU:9682]
MDGITGCFDDWSFISLCMPHSHRYHRQPFSLLPRSLHRSESSKCPRNKRMYWKTYRRCNYDMTPLEASNATMNWNTGTVGGRCNNLATIRIIQYT